jgi:hypothetical protein
MSWFWEQRPMCVARPVRFSENQFSSLCIAQVYLWPIFLHLGTLDIFKCCIHLLSRTKKNIRSHEFEDAVYGIVKKMMHGQKRYHGRYVDCSSHDRFTSAHQWLCGSGQGCLVGGFDTVFGNSAGEFCDDWIEPCLSDTPLLRGLQDFDVYSVKVF